MEKMKEVEIRERGVGETEGGRSPTGVSPTAPLRAGSAHRAGNNGVPVSVAGLAGTRCPDPEVLEKATRRRFTAEYKARLLEEADACTEPGRIGALLRREGLYSSSLAMWRKQREQGTLTGLTPKQRGRKQQKDSVQQENERLRRENLRLQEKLRQAEVIIEVQKKVSEILGVPLKTPESEGNN